MRYVLRETGDGEVRNVCSLIVNQCQQCCIRMGLDLVKVSCSYYYACVCNIRSGSEHYADFNFT